MSGIEKIFFLPEQQSHYKPNSNLKTTQLA